MSPLSRRDFTKAAALAAGTALSRGRTSRRQRARQRWPHRQRRTGQQVWKTLPQAARRQPGRRLRRLRAVPRRAGWQLAGGAAEGLKDFRRVLDRKDVDAVIVATPDHWHALPTIARLRGGQGRLRREAALAHRRAKGGAMVEAARKHERVVQTGSQQRSGAHYRAAVKLVREGEIGDGPQDHRRASPATSCPGFMPREA